VTLALRYAALSHVGLLRTGNEDSAYAGPRLLAVADGMGGHAAGEVASAVAIASIAALDEDAPGADLLTALRTAAVGANDHLRDMVAGDAALEGMGTTLTSLLFTGNRLGLLHIGDSRCYLLRSGQLTQITHDDTLVQSLVDEGRISEAEAGHHPQRSVITRALDGRGDVDFDTSVREVRLGDRYLLCTDGLTGPVASRDTLQDALELPEPRDAAERLVQLALRGGGPDNVTVIVADVVEGDSTGLPAVAGAAAEAPQPVPPHLTDGAAGRAAARRPAPTAALPTASSVPVADPGPPDRQRLRRVITLGVLVVGLLVLSVGTGWAYVRSQWFVGDDGGRVAVYRGVSGEVGGVELASVEERTALSTGRLSELDRESLSRGITAEGSDDAQRIVASLEERAEPCPDAVPSSAPGSPAPLRSSPTLLGTAATATPDVADACATTEAPSPSVSSPSPSATR